LTDLILTLVPLGLFVALSPVPIVAVILLLGTKHPIGNGFAFALGWVIAIVAIGVVGLAVLSPQDFHRQSSASKGVAALQLLVGAVLLSLALRKARNKPAAAGERPEPRWMTRIETLQPVTALVAGLAFFLVNIGDVLVAVVATAHILQAEVSTKQSIVALAVFTGVATVSILLPVVLYAAAPERSAALLESWKAWLSVPQNTMIAVFVLIGTLLVVNGLRGLV
jgi:threonine/homoserine/homoserine lactone efflux protein